MHPISLVSTDSSIGPSASLLSAALSGLLSLGLAGCGDDKTSPGEEHEHDDDSQPDAATGDAAVDSDAAALNDAGTDAATGPIVTKEIPGVQAFAALKARCDSAGGYVQLHAACSGANTCKGFSYGDWGDDSVLSEHTCASMNGCTGLSCVYTAPDSGKDGKAVYEADRAPGGPSSCLNCHAEWSEDVHGESTVDMTKFKVWVLPGSTTRTAENWLEGVSVEQQEGIVAFGAVRAYTDGTPVVSMSGYHKLISRVETQKVVEYIRTQLTPVIAEIGKTK